ncbi:transporter substrate-binding domain-containing protein [Mycolicibacterium sp. 018/SC-01/001]|uniref:transporter substrate-binding domain-containing protein n=1 Tax=Mycolicibacterium sp. 018/SC-01/001 TaxID=2592069 RepID=UPI00117F8BF2|nr:transporter substrate-binding domain-containing protein [Mycolicibacterium sp. 018/SC-01/001]TRW83192.1 transporter substrate-binding domain-containing protein [Mycolicibacterium sp. 018/SC-01/001]
MGTLRAGLVGPYPPFTSTGSGLDAELIAALGDRLGDDVVVAPIVTVADGWQRLVAGDDDVLLGGLPATAQQGVTFLPPYVITGQGLAVNTRRLPHVHSPADLGGRTLCSPDRDTLPAAVADLASGACDALLELAPVLGELVRDVPDVELVARGLSVAEIAIAVAAENTPLLARLQVAQAELESDGTLQRLRRRWLGNPFVDQAAAVR